MSAHKKMLSLEEIPKNNFIWPASSNSCGINVRCIDISLINIFSNSSVLKVSKKEIIRLVISR